MRDPVADLLACVVRGIVSMPEDVRVTASEDQDGWTYEVQVAEDDMGKVIGRQGRVAQALRQVARAAAIRQRRRVQVEFVS